MEQLAALHPLQIAVGPNRLDSRILVYLKLDCDPSDLIARLKVFWNVDVGGDLTTDSLANTVVVAGVARQIIRLIPGEWVTGIIYDSRISMLPVLGRKARNRVTKDDYLMYFSGMLHKVRCISSSKSLPSNVQSRK